MDLLYGNTILTYVTNGNVVEIIQLREILIASLGLIFIPKDIKIDIEDIIGRTKFLPNIPNNMLEQKTDTINKLNNMSETISEIADVYKDVATTVIDEEKIEEDKQIFIDAFLDCAQNISENNILIEDITNLKNGILDEIFDILLKNEEITENDLINIFAEKNTYILSVDDKELRHEAEKNIFEIIKNINYTYKLSKLNFVLKKQINENKKTISNQLDGVSKVISNLAENISEKNNQKKQEDELLILLKQKGINAINIKINQDENKKYIIDIYSIMLDEVSEELEKTKKIEEILSKFLGQKVVLQKQKNNINENNEELQTYSFEDKYTIQVGCANTKKYDSTVSGDSTIQTKLNDGKYMFAISDGMGSNIEAKKSSSVAIKMLKRLLTSGFDKDASLELINSTLYLNSDEEMYSTLDIAIFDLYIGKVEFIKNGAMPTFIKNGKNIEVINNESLPAGLVNDLKLVVHDTEIKENDIIVMCSDGIIESNKEKREKWIKELLEGIKINTSQKIADIILQEAIDNNYGKPKDDMSVIVAKISSTSQI